MASAPEAPVAAASPARSAYATDWLKGCRAGWHGVTKLLAGHKVSAGILSLLPSVLITGVLIYLSTKAGSSLMFSQIAGGYVGALAALTYLFGLLGLFAVIFSWPGVLSIAAKAYQIISHFFIST